MLCVKWITRYTPQYLYVWLRNLLVRRNRNPVGRYNVSSVAVAAFHRASKHGSLSTQKSVTIMFPNLYIYTGWLFLNHEPGYISGNIILLFYIFEAQFRFKSIFNFESRASYAPSRNCITYSIYWQRPQSTDPSFENVFMKIRKPRFAKITE